MYIFSKKYCTTEAEIIWLHHPFAVKSCNLNTDVDHCFNCWNTKEFLNAYNISLIVHLNTEENLYFL